MNFETVKKSNKTKIITGVIVLLILTSVVMFVSTRAKYRSIQSLKLANGTINYSAPDLKLAIKVSENGTDYTSRTDIPTSGYTFNTEKSKCRIPTSTLTGENAPVAEGVTIEYTDGKINVLGVTQKDTRCYVYFDKVLNQTSSSIIADIENSNYFKSGRPSFNTKATGIETESNNGIYKVSDGMYNGYSYYWRGAATTNHVIFDNKCWRIVRINGDGSIRLIYNGIPSENTCSGNGSNGMAVIMGTDTSERSYATSDKRSDNPSYVGWTYSLNIQRTTGGTESNAKVQTEKWYRDNISANAKAKVDSNGKFCNDRNIGNPISSFGWYNHTYVTNWSSWTSDNSMKFAYAGLKRLEEDYNPTMSCPSGDVYSLSVGAISADEVQFAGGKHEGNDKYYLYTAMNYWTMSPAYKDSSIYVFIVYGDGGLSYDSVGSIYYGLRPVINLLPTTQFSLSSDGTQNNPYIVQ